MTTLEKLAERLRTLRIQHELTQEEFGAISGFSQKYYQQIESGKKKQIWLETVERLADAYGLEAWELLCPKLPAKTKLTKKPSPSRSPHKKKTQRRKSST